MSDGLTNSQIPVRSMPGVAGAVPANVHDVDSIEAKTVDTVTLWKGNNKNGWMLGEDGKPRKVLIEWPIEGQLWSTTETLKPVKGIVNRRTGKPKMMPENRAYWEHKGYVLAEEAESVTECPAAIVKWLVERSLQELEHQLKYDKAPFEFRRNEVTKHKAFLEGANESVFAPSKEEEPTKGKGKR